MNSKQIICVIAVLGLITCSGAQWTSDNSSVTYTAKTLIKVLPYPDKDPMTIVTPPVDRTMQYGFRVSLASLIKQQQNLRNLLHRDKIRQTGWFKHFGKTEDERFPGASKDLKKNLKVFAREHGDHLNISMTCGDKYEAALIVNEMVDLFLTSQTTLRRGDIKTKLANIERRRENIRQELDYAEAAMRELVERSGLVDLEVHNYPHPVTARLQRLERERDNLLLEIRQVEATIGLQEKQKDGANSSSASRDSLVVLRQKFEELERMRREAEAQQKELDSARRQYRQRAFIRDERRARLVKIKALMEKLRIMHDDPEVAKVRFVAEAAIGLEPDKQRR